MAYPSSGHSANVGHYAGFASRLLAFITDAVIITFAVVGFTWFINATAAMLQFKSIFAGSLVTLLPESRQWLDNLSGPWIRSLITFLFIICYHAFFWSVGGQTPGKAFVGLRVVSFSGAKISFMRSLVRYLSYFISVLPLFLGFFWILIDDRRQSFHDKVVNTCVIYTWDARPDERFLADEIIDSQDG